MRKNNCKICGSSSLKIYAHTAKCNYCKVLLYYPYPEDDSTQVAINTKSWLRESVLNYYSKSSYYNHVNFTNMVRFAMEESYKGRQLDVLDFGGGAGQFALVLKSHFPESSIYITDISDESLLEEWSPLNIQIPFKDFNDDLKKFDFIFLNDVFEHVSNPSFVLNQIANKLKTDGKIFIDTPKQFWIYPLTKLISKSLYTKVLRGTVSTAHLQIWSKKAFEFVVQGSGLKVIKYKETSEYTMPAIYYLKNMGIKNPLVRLAGRIFYGNAKWLAKNKIVCVLANKPLKPI